MSDREKVILDTDFMKYMIRGRAGSDYYFEKIVEDLKIEPVIHEFLYNKEMMDNPLVYRLVKENKITVLRYEDFLKNIDDPYYDRLFSDLYKYCNGHEIKYNKSNFRTYQESEANLGEIHSVILALYTGYTVFFSNDNGSKAMAKAKINTAQYTLNVKNVMDVFEEISQLDSKATTKMDFVKLTKGDKSRKKYIQKIRTEWKE